jgi:4-hydroxybenzoate polyprenyltransferase
MSQTPRWLAFAQLLRLPNVFTAWADIALASAAATAVLDELPAWFLATTVLLALASGSLYLAGMVWNDVFDLAEDAESRPFRPLPSGRVSRRTAVFLGTLLILGGLALAAGAGAVAGRGALAAPFGYAVAIAIAVLAYDGGLKRSPLGPVSMAACRFLNVLLGLSPFPPSEFPWDLRLPLAGVVGLYIAGVTWFARTEEGSSSRRQLTAAAGVIALSLGSALFLRASLPPNPDAVLFPYLLVAFGFVVGRPVATAIADPRPHRVQAAVKRCVLGLIGLDSVLATAFVGPAGLLILFLLPPALVIGKWVYST